MFINLLQVHPTYYVTWVLAVIASVVLHELGHGFAAIRQGDRTPIVSGHMTLNPMVHMGGISLILLAVVGLAFGAMPVNPSAFRGRFGRAAVAFAGPAVNLLIAASTILLAGLLVRTGLVTLPMWEPHVIPYRLDSVTILLIVAQLNLALFAFNLLPIPPLDGSTVLGDFWPDWKRWTSNPDLAPFFQAGFLLVFIFGARLFVAAGDATGIAFRALAGG